MYINSPLNYTGNKFKQLDQLEKLLPENTDKLTLIDLFAGSCSVSMNFANKFQYVICNDVIEDLIDLHTLLYNCQNENDLFAILEQFSSDVPEQYHTLRNAYNDCLNKNERAYRLYGLILSCTNNFMRFNKSMKFNQTCGKRKFNDNTKRKLHEWLNLLSTIKNIAFNCCDFSHILVPANSFIYCDPPYSNTEAGYNALWKIEDDIRLYNYLMNNADKKIMVSSSMQHGNKKSKLVEQLIESHLFNINNINFNYKKVAKKEKETIEICLTNY